jgi:hypothetical protein
MVLLGLALLAAGFAAGAGWASGLGRCRAEDACWVDYPGRPVARWVVVPGHADRRPGEGWPRDPRPRGPSGS